MPTPYIRIQNAFHSRIQTTRVIEPELEAEFLESALSDYESELNDLVYDESTEEFVEELSRPQINLIADLMYKAYLERELDRILKLNNIVGKDVSMTGLGDSKRVTLSNLERVERKIQKKTHNLKSNTYYDEG